MVIIIAQILLIILKVVGICTWPWIVILIPILAWSGINIMYITIKLTKMAINERRSAEKWRNNRMKYEITELEEAMMLDCSKEDIKIFKEAAQTEKYIKELKKAEKKIGKIANRYWRNGIIIWEPRWLKIENKKEGRK